MLATDPVGEATGAMAEVDTRTEGINGVELEVRLIMICRSKI